MYKGNQSKNKHRMVTVLSLCFLILGVSGISLAMQRIWLLPNEFNDNSVTSTTKSILDIATILKETESSSAYGPLETNTPAAAEDIENDILTPSNVTPVIPDADEFLLNMNPAVGEKMGSLTFPSLKQEFPIIQGTDANALKKGVGHFLDSVMPGTEDNCVLSAHRETFFKELGKLVIGDIVIVQTAAGTFTYNVTGTRIVDAEDRTVIVPTDHAVLTLTTCYPFDTPGYSPDRYIVSADMVINQ